MKLIKLNRAQAALLGGALVVAGLGGNARAVDFRLDDLVSTQLTHSEPAFPADLVQLAALPGPPAEIIEDPVWSFAKNATSVQGVKLAPSGLQQLIRQTLNNPDGAGDGLWGGYLRQEIRNWTSSHLDRLGTSSLWDHTSLGWLKPGDQDSHRLYHSWTGPQDPDPASVPDSASTLALLTVAALGLTGLRMKFSQSA